MPGLSFMPLCQDESNKVRGMGAVQLLFLHIKFIVLLKGIVQLPKSERKQKTLNYKIPPCQKGFFKSVVQNGPNITGSGLCRGDKERSSASGDAGHRSAIESNGCYSNLYGQEKHTRALFGEKH